MAAFIDYHKRKDTESPENTLLIDTGSTQSLMSIKKSWPSPACDPTGQRVLNEDNLYNAPGQKR
jgi:hypothetical protein